MNKVKAYSQIKTELEEIGTLAKKQKGQHFLIDEFSLKTITNSLEIKPDDVIYEIGPGTGQLTQYLYKHSKNLRLIEIDQQLIPLLSKKFPQSEIINEDILKFNFPYPQENQKFKLAGNLPYYITSPILEKIVEHYQKFKSVVIMIQYEVAKRILATPGNKDYSRITLFIQNFFEVKMIKKLSGSMYYPPARVASASLLLTPRTNPQISSDLYPIFTKVVKAAFSQRRKNILNCLKSFPSFNPIKNQMGEILKTAGLNTNLRGETLGFEEFDKLSKLINHAINQL